MNSETWRDWVIKKQIVFTKVAVRDLLLISSSSSLTDDSFVSESLITPCTLFNNNKRNTVKALVNTDATEYTFINEITAHVTPKGDHWLSQRYSELYLNTPSKPLRWLSKKCRWRDLNSQPQRSSPGSIPSLMLQTARFYARLYYHAQTWAHNLLRQKVITDWVSAIVSYILTAHIICENLKISLISLLKSKSVKGFNEHLTKQSITHAIYSDLMI